MMEHAQDNYPDLHHDMYSKTLFGFWLYLLSDFILFGSLFATYAVLKNGTYGGPSGRELFQLPFVFYQSLILLLCSFTSALAGGYAHRKNVSRTVLFFAATFVLGALFLWMEMREMSHFLSAGFGWQRSAFLSAYFTIIGTHAAHMVFALLWVIVLLIPLFYEGLTMTSIRRLTCLRMFWQFLNVIWVLIFTLIYCTSFT